MLKTLTSEFVAAAPTTNNPLAGNRFMAQLPDEKVVRISEALFNGRKIEAIRVYREATGLGLKESKDFIDALEARLRQESPEKFKAAPSGVGCSTAAMTMMLAVAAAWLLYQLLM